ncbi:MAG TPA: hypothetical protein VG456_14080 [Candidatus Sulfopaludibacter sp.]|jgi:hypothetical protein|nr:hypothetical protein [Candidatus Sulfopaludibacter sp.]
MATAIQRLEVQGSATAPIVVKAATPQILRINRYTLRPETESAMRNLQKQVALALVQWGNPQPSVAIEALTGPKEVWCLTGFQSSQEQRQIAEKLEGNDILRSALDRIESQVRVLTGNPSTVMATYQQSGRRGRSWLMGRGHYLVIAVSPVPSGIEGTCYQTAAGQQYFISATRTRKDADARAAQAGPTAHVFAIRPTWGMPAREWVNADPEFWNASPVAKQGPPPASHFKTLTKARW